MECNFENCVENTYKHYNYCILHIGMPDEADPTFQEIRNLKKSCIEKKLKSKDFNFYGAKLYEIDFSRRKIEGPLYFVEVDIKKDVNFDGAEVLGDVIFNGSKIGGSIHFDNKNNKSKSTTIHGDVEFRGSNIGKSLFFRYAIIEGSVKFDGGTNIKFVTWFSNAKVGGSGWFSGVTFGNFVNFREAKFGRSLLFQNSSVGRDAWFYCINIKNEANFSDTTFNKDVYFNAARIGGITSFNNSNIKEEAFFDGAKIEGRLSFDNTTFGTIEGQEEAYLKAKTVYDNLGDRIEADKYFFKEMVAKRKQKAWYKRYPEKALLEYGFGYGVYPLRVMVTWLVVILFFTIIYSTEVMYSTENLVYDFNSFLSYFYSSVVTAITPGFGTYRPSGNYQIWASIEAIIGTFLWATLIATFARKYMR